MSSTNLYHEIETLPKGESLVYVRENFCHDVDEEDRIIYMSAARKMAAKIKCDIAVAENTLTFTKKSKTHPCYTFTLDTLKLAQKVSGAFRKNPGT